jgi:UPF0271 protein
MRVWLNCDMGELADAALEEALMAHVDAANIACGGHAGDEPAMRRTIALALRHGVRIGAHPGYPDRAHFGRLELTMELPDVAATVEEQVRRLAALTHVAHVKPHGALYNAAARNPALARAIAEGVARWSTGVVLVGLASSPMLDVWRAMGFQTAAEGFADRRYEQDGSLRSRKLPGALITDPRAAAAQAVRLAGSADTVCIHSDTPGAVEIAKVVRSALEGSGDGQATPR